MTVAVSGESITFNDNSVQATAPKVGMVNRIINGAMVIDQRNAGAAVTLPITTTQYTLDRWNAQSSGASKYSVQRNAGSITPPAGFTNYFGVTSLANTAVGASDYYDTYQAIEGFNTADFGWGTTNAQPITISFWVRSSLTGTFGASIRNGFANRSYPFSYAVSAANTWEQKTITIAGDTTGTWATDNNAGLFLTFGFGVGSTFSATAGSWQAGNFFSATGATSVVGTSGATFYITGVQLEKGSTATSFDYRPYGTELGLCQRYGFGFSAFYLGFTNGVTEVYQGAMRLPVTMRATPTLSGSSSFAASSGSAGVVGIGNSVGRSTTADGVCFVNNNSDWTNGVRITVTGFLTSEL